MKKTLLRPDLCVIGAGAGGLSVVAAAASMGVPVVLVEKGEMGGDCLNFGCVPSKALLAAARSAQAMREAGIFGVGPTQPKVDFAALQARIRDVIASIALNDSQARFEALGAQVIRAAGRFVSKTVLEAGDCQVLARRFVIATGSSPKVPVIPGLEMVRFLTNETIFSLAEAPSRLIVLGAGPTGLEIAQAHRRLGSEVIVLDEGRALSREDPELAAIVIARIVDEGVQLLQGARMLRVEPHGTGVRAIVEHGAGELAIEGSHLLIAAGRQPNVEGLGLEAAGVAFDRAGVSVGANLRTTNRRIYAVGDAAGKEQYTHAANYHAGVVLKATLFRLWSRADARLIPRVACTDPEIAMAGLDESQARARRIDIQVLRWPFSENDRARADGETRGHLKVIATKSGRVLGAGIVGARAGELIGLWQLAIAKRLSIADVASLVLPYPTLSEASRRAALVGVARGLRNPWLSPALRFLRRFG